MAYRWWLPILLFLILAPFTPWIDLNLASYFYEPNGFISQKDPGYPISSAIFTYSELPGQLIGVVAVLIVILSYFSPRFSRWRKPALVVAITAVIGAALFVNVVFKEFWARPRPKQVEQFGGTEPFRPFYKPMHAPKGEQLKSFPSGHAAMGFLFLSFGLIGWYERRRPLFIGGIAFGLAWGIFLSYTRMAQGGHFFSDVLASALLMWLVALVACRIAYGPASEVKAA